MKTAVLFGVLFTASFAHAYAVSCQMVDGVNLESKVRVYLLSDGRFGLEASSCEGHVLAHTYCLPYTKLATLEEGSVQAGHRRVPNGVFSGEGIDIVHIAGGYQYTDSTAGLSLYFPDASCQE